ncbi:MAG: tetratricopeptide repeat protein [Candidatus Heimdallarchaeota archaeon]|nr:tetratricopeptide repeat protein [Candidatus Heimdallarchaeota archaeon]
MANEEKEKRSFILELITEARSHVHHNRKTDALNCYDKILTKYSNEISALYGKGMVYYQFDDYPLALEYFEEVLRINPNEIDSLYAKGSILSRQGQLLEAIDVFDKVAEINPHMELALIAKGYVLLDLEKTAAALDCFTRAEKLGGKLELLAGKGHALRKLNNKGEAKNYYLMALKYDPYDPEALMGLGLMSYEEKKLKEAQDYLYKSVVQDEDNLEAWTILCEIFKATNQKDKEEIARNKITKLQK